MPLAEALNVLCSLVSSVYWNQQLFPFTTILGWQYLARYYLVPFTWSHMTGPRVRQRVMILHLRPQMVSSFPLFLWTIQFQAYFIIHFQEINVVNNAVWFVSYPSRRSSFGQGKWNIYQVWFLVAMWFIYQVWNIYRFRTQGITMAKVNDSLSTKMDGNFPWFLALWGLEWFR